MFGKKFDPVEAGLVYPKQEKSGPAFVEFRGATMDFDDEGKLQDLVPRSTIMINVREIEGFYDHTILINGRKLRVMETLTEIRNKVEAAL